MKIYKITEASEYLGVSINTLKTLADNGKINGLSKLQRADRYVMHELMKRRREYIKAAAERNK